MPAGPYPCSPPLKSSPPLSLVLRLTLDHEHPGTGGSGDVHEAVEVGAAGKRGVDHDGEAQVELRGGDVPKSGVREVVEEGRGSRWGGEDDRVALEGKSRVADVVFVEKRAAESGSYAFG
ncbi:hypothetical protein Ancab_037768 [Ancistrocladus abbreviatus]